MGKCVVCKVFLPPNASTRRKYCDKCIKERQIKAGKSRKGIPYLPSSYHNCQNCGGRFMAKSDTTRTLCNKCLKARQSEVYRDNKPKIAKAIRKKTEVRGMWYTCECGSAVTWRNTHINRDKTAMVGVESCSVCGRERHINEPVIAYCVACSEPLLARKGTSVKYCPNCAKQLKAQEIQTYFDGLLGIEASELLILHRHTVAKKLKELNKLL